MSTRLALLDRREHTTIFLRVKRAYGSSVLGGLYDAIAHLLRAACSATLRSKTGLIASLKPNVPHVTRSSSTITYHTEGGLTVKSAAIKRPPKQETYSPERIIAALIASRGRVTVAARTLGCSRQTIYDSIKRHPEIREVVDEAREMQLDLAELKLFQAIDKGEPWVITLYLKTQGRERGYFDKEHGGPARATLEQLVLMAHKLEQEEQKAKS